MTNKKKKDTIAKSPAIIFATVNFLCGTHITLVLFECETVSVTSKTKTKKKATKISFSLDVSRTQETNYRIRQCNEFRMNAAYK